MKSIDPQAFSPELPDFSFSFDLGEFDINAAVNGAMSDVASQTELALDEKIRRMEVIVSEGTSDVYRDFVDFRQMAQQMIMMCNHNHALGQSIQGSELLSGFMGAYDTESSHSHVDSLQVEHAANGHDQYEIDPETGKRTKKKKKKRR